MVYSLSYRRPAHVSKLSTASSFSDSGSDNEKDPQGRRPSGLSGGIPDALSFDRIIEEGTCPPCTTRDFLNYLLYIEHAAENLQFYLWFRDYEKRFNEATSSDITLAPVWTQEQQDTALQTAQAQASAQQTTAYTRSDVEAIMKNSEFGAPGRIPAAETTDPFTTPPQTPQSGALRSIRSRNTSEYKGSESVSENFTSTSESYHQVAGEAFQAVGLGQPFTVQPFRQEIDRVIATYIISRAPRELNLSSRERTVVLKALHYTTHPSALRAIFKSTEHTLRRQAHPNFIRWTICNGNRPRVIFARGLGIFLIVASFIIAILLTLSDIARGWRALAAVGWVLGIATLICAWKGLCVVLHGMHSRNVRPWELFEKPESDLEMKKSFETFDTSNSYEDAPWVVEYKKRNILRKILDRQVWVKEPALRQIQDTIFLQSLLSALLASGILTAIFVSIPGGGHF